MGDRPEVGVARRLEQEGEDWPPGAEVLHALKNPLTGVRALVQLGLRNPREAASHRRLEAVERELDRMQDILRTHLAPERRKAGAYLERVELAPLVSGALRVLSARARHARVRLVARGDGVVRGDPRRLQEAIVNLVANGIEATPPGGEVAVDVRSGEVVEIAVRDSGRGIAPELLDRVGTPFLTTREDGTGLGVALARSAIAEHGGTVRYESSPGSGTTVRVTLPSRGRQP
jgi:two-component system sensor histidine kinase HydH